MAVIEAKNSSLEKLSEELSAQQQKAHTLRSRVSELEQNLQSATSAASSTKFREQSLKQELELLQRNNDWLETELKTKNADHLKFRKDKNAHISELQQLNEQYISEAETLRRSEASLKSRLDEQIQKVEDSLATVQELREEAVQAAESFRVELDSASRLAELQKKSADTAKQRAQELSTALDEVKEEAADEIGRIRAEVETEHNDKIAAERFISELQQSISELEQSSHQLQTELDLLKAEPNRYSEAHGQTLATPSRPSPARGIFSPNSTSKIQGNLSMTQLFSEYKRVEKELSAEKRHAEQLSRSLEEMVDNLEKTQPEIDELRADHGRLSTEVLDISSLRDEAVKGRDRATRELKKVQGHIQEAQRERDVYQQQLRDASSQIKVLLMEQHFRENGQSVSEAELREIRSAAAGDETDLAAMTDTGRIISENLTVFKNIAELQEQNLKIRSMLRQLGERMEANEAQEKSSSRQLEHEELELLRTRVSTYKDELQNMVTQSKSYIKERDMFRNMLVRRGQLPSQVEPSAFAQSMPLPTAEAKNGSEADYGKLLKDLQQHFDSYKQEAATDNTALKNQLDEVSKRNAQLQIELSKHASQVGAANQRSEMLQTNYNMLKSESVELQRRSETIRENASKQEIKTQQAAEELVEAKGEMDNLQRESANLRAEKDLWKSIEQRLLQDNEDLRGERSRLDNLNATLQNLLNEREQADAESLRNSRKQVESLELELQNTKRKLNEEMEECKSVKTRREYEQEQGQQRVSDLMTSLSKTREESIAAKTARDHLQGRVDELTIELRSAEERLHLMQSRDSIKTGIPQEANDESDANRDQELSIEIAEMRRDLELKDNELNRLKEQVETYKEISQSSEERLQELSESNDQYREEMERTVEARDATIKDLEQRVQEISGELATTNSDLTALHDEKNGFERRLSEQRVSFENEIRRLKDQVEQQTAHSDQLLEDVRLQAKIASDHQQSYDNELLKHAEAAKNLQTMRSENNQLRLEIVELNTVAKSAKTGLEQQEASWAEQQVRTERELEDLRKRRDEIGEQNALLHHQLEEITKQFAQLKKDRTTVPGNESVPMATSGLEDLQEVIKYLRREKEIVDVQYHLSTQESKRLKQQLDHTQSQLDETRLKLDQQLRMGADVERNALSHNKLIETLNELNLYRESSVTLRAEAKNAAAALLEKSQRVDELLAETSPLRTRITELESLAELREGEIKLLQEDRDHWQMRTQNILAKYDRVDPAELESLKERISTLENERNELTVVRDGLQEQVDSIPEQIEAAKQDLRTRLAEQFKGRHKELTGRISQKQVELDAITSQKAEMQNELDSSKEQLRQIRDNPPTQQVNGIVTEPLAHTAEDTDVEHGNHELQRLQKRVMDLEAELADKVKEAEALQAEKNTAVKARESEMQDVLNQRLAEVKAEMQSASTAAIQDLEAKLEAQQAAPDASRTTEADNTKPGAGTQSGEESALQEQSAGPQEVSEKLASPRKDLTAISEEEARMLVRENETIRNILKANVRKLVDTARENLRKELSVAPTENDPARSSALSEELNQKFAAEKETLVKELDQKFDVEKQSIIRAQEEKCASEKRALLDEQEANIASARQTTIIDLQEKFAEERLTLSKEAERKIADQVALAEKRTAAKMNLALNQAKNANAKIQVVVRAAEETPEKAVKEVWASAKDAKPPPANPTTASPKPVSATPAPVPPTTQEQDTPKDDKVSVDTGSDQRSEDVMQVPTNQAQPVPPETTNPSAISTATAAPNSPGEIVEAKQVSQQPQNGQSQSGIPKPGQANASHIGSGMARSLQSHLPRGNRGGRGGGQTQPHQQSATAPETQQPSQQGAGRGSGIPRGGPRGRGQNRGGNQQVATSMAPNNVQGQAGGSPRGAINPQAKQFNPQGSKRGREDGAAEEQGGKRIRGGGAGS